jgi:prephenate dehydrogenase
MKIAILGYGKMGKIIEKIAQDRKHEIVLKIDVTNQDELTTENLQKGRCGDRIQHAGNCIRSYRSLL